MSFYSAAQFIRHFFLATDLHGIHAPFLADFYKNILHKKTDLSAFKDILSLKKCALKNSKEIEVTDLGAGSKNTRLEKRKISQIAKHASTPTLFSAFLYRLIRHYKLGQSLELGTSLGFNTAFLSMAVADKQQVVSMEGCSNIAREARKNLNKLNCQNVMLEIGNIDDLLPQILPAYQWDLVYIDANHTYEATLNYVEQIFPHCSKKAIIIIDDIYWSRAMYRAWKKLTADNRFSLKIDLFEAGLLFCDPTLSPDHIRLWKSFGF